MFQIAPCVNTLCSYSATSLPSAAGVSRSSRIVFDGRLPSNVPVRHEPVGRAFGLDLLGRLAERQRFGLREDVRQQHVVMPAERIERLAEGDEVARNEPRALVNQLIERVLAVGARLAPVDRPGVASDRRRRRA